MFDLAIGLGQGGSRIAKEVVDIFGIKGRYINTATVDYHTFNVPSKSMLVLDGKGTGRNPEFGEQIAKRYGRDLMRFLSNNTTEVTSVVLCVGGGGGSGTGLMFSVIDFLLSNNVNVFLMYTLPRKVEGIPVKPFALKYLNKLLSKYVGGNIPKNRQVSVMLIDNDFCISKYSDQDNTDEDYWRNVNRGIVRSLKYFYELTVLDNHSHVDISSGVGALDHYELMKLLYFKDGIVDLRNIIFESPDVEDINLKLKTSSQVFGSLDIRTAKAYIVSISLPYEWKQKKGINKFVDDVFNLLAKSISTPYVLRTSFYNKKVKIASVRLFLVGMTKSHGLEKILRQTNKDTEKYKSKDTEVQQMDLSSLDFDL